MNSLKAAALIAAVLVAGVGLRIGVFSGMRSLHTSVAQDPAAAPQGLEPQAAAPQAPKTSSTTRPTQPTTTASVLVSSPAAPVASQPPAPRVIAFEELTPCDQLDAVAKAGKSVSDFLVAAHRVNDLAKYQAAIRSICPWNAEQLQVADRLIHPPVITVRSNEAQSPSRSANSGKVREASGPPPLWNNCNGIQEPGESYSAACDAAQQENDEILSNGHLKPLNPIDNRPPWRQPSLDQPVPPYDRGYSAN